jgi:rare lipoprotein A
MNRRFVSLAALPLLSALLFNCACRHRRAAVAQAPRASQPNAKQNSNSAAAPNFLAGYREEGIASWYGVPFHGRPAADGEIYNMEALVAAHRTMPFNTWVKVTNLANNEAVNVRIIDRGPFVDGRILDLSKAAARDIGLIGPGTGRVRIEVISAAHDIPRNDFFAVQTGAFSSRDSAEHLRADYAKRFGNAQLATRADSPQLWRVLVGKEPSLDAAQQLAIVLSAENKHVFVVRLDQTVVTRTSGSSAVPGP